jgi:Putative regulator of cell autolysis
MMHKLFLRVEKVFSRIKLRNKMILLFVCCVLIPLMVTDGLVFYNVYNMNKITKEQELSADAEAIRYGMVNFFEYPAILIQNIYKNGTIEKLLNNTYEKPLDYYNELVEFKRSSLDENWLGSGCDRIVIYADNNTILNGGMFYKLDTVREENWYKKLSNSEGLLLMFAFSKDGTETFSKRSIFLLRKLDRYRKNSCEKVLKLDINYRNFLDTVLNDSIESDVYICQDERVLMTNVGGTHFRETYSFMDKDVAYDYEYSFNLYGQTFTVYLKSRNTSFWKFNPKMVYLVVFVIILNLILPLFMIGRLLSSVARRIDKLDNVFEDAGSEKLTKIDKIEGNDEITSLMKNYNVMADRMNDLIQTVYVDKLKEQEMDIARQNAELQALHSQINPHFLFNALESIRMRSLIKSEKETAEMVEHLALMQRANVNWHSDVVSLEEEISFIEAYLKLQKYRFGERLNYDIEVDESCRDVKLPRLSIVTFVENACVHGIEGKTEKGWIFVRVYPDGNKTVIEVEDTGIGIDEEVRDILLFKMNNANIDLIKTGRGIGMTNACLRLKMMTKNRVDFGLESEVGVGTTVVISLYNDEEKKDGA